ncbi:ubiquinol-cytochrome C chaperone family protein [Kordiimonas aquimaris]|uniref:ubiquinol-cytochrome C chaperone family protein n=1 Tax=Kordiimonas aquimaris TaxID=707591 RepID=UPI0021D2F475|nr:ubiquinol-cytochrome C chaperone family protein [Kordiimonas aquimaris]
MKGLFKSFRDKRRMKQEVHLLYKQLVDQARKPVLYQPPYSIEDTIDGRFSLILLHLFIVDRALSDASRDNVIRRMLQETLVSDMDRSLRELGVGDMSVGKEMKKVGATLLGCMKSYSEAMNSDDKTTSLKAVIIRNITENEEAASALATYTLDTVQLISYNWNINDLHTKNVFNPTVATK